MLPFRCAACGRPSEQAAVCASCGARTFTLSPDAAVHGPAARARDAASPPPPVPIEQARLRRRQRPAR